MISLGPRTQFSQLWTLPISGCRAACQNLKLAVEFLHLLPRPLPSTPSSFSHRDPYLVGILLPFSLNPSILFYCRYSTLSRLPTSFVLMSEACTFNTNHSTHQQLRLPLLLRTGPSIESLIQAPLPPRELSASLCASRTTDHIRYLHLPSNLKISSSHVDLLTTAGSEFFL